MNDTASTDNPYRAPGNESSGTGFVDREQRRALARIVNQYLRGELASFDFDDQLDEFRSSSDTVVRFVAYALWGYCDDLVDHHVDLGAADWEIFQRLLLLLATDATMHRERYRQWHVTQLIALGTFVAAFYVLLRADWSWHLWLLLIPQAIVSICIRSWRRRIGWGGSYAPDAFPFATSAEVQMWRERTGLVAAPYPPHLAQPRIRSVWATRRMLLWLYSMWVLWAPLVLLFQLLPASAEQIDVEAGAEGARP